MDVNIIKDGNNEGVGRWEGEKGNKDEVYKDYKLICEECDVILSQGLVVVFWLHDKGYMSRLGKFQAPHLNVDRPIRRTVWI